MQPYGINWIQGGDAMRNILVCGFIILFLALSSDAVEPAQLSGANGNAILMQIAGPSKVTNPTATSMIGLWDWSKLPSGYSMNAAGQLIPTQQILEIDYGGWLSSI